METFAELAPRIGLLFFFGVFVYIVLTTMRPSKKDELEEHRFIPLMEDK